MAFHTRTYAVYAWLAPAGEPPWAAQTWAGVAAALDPLLAAVRGPVAVRSSQLQGAAGKMKPIAFGRLGWRAADHCRWALVKANRHFIGAEVWAPGWTACERRVLAPEVFFAVMNPGEDEGALLVLAVARDLPAGVAASGLRAARAVGKAVAALRQARRERPWGYGSGGGFERSLQDLEPGEVFTRTGLARGWSRL